MRAWAEMFDAFLSAWDAPGADTSPYTDADYFAHVDGKPRYDGVRDLLTARGIRLPDGDPSDPPDARHRVRPGQPQERRLQHRARPRRRHRPTPARSRCSTVLRELRMPLAVVSSSANAPAVLAAAGLADRFVTVVDGRVATALGPGRQAGPRHLRARRHRVRHHPGPLGRRRGRRLGGAGRRRRCVRAGHRRRPRGRCRHAHGRRGRSRRRRPRRPRVKPRQRLGRPARPQPVPRRPLAPGRVRPRPQRPRRHRDPVHRRERLHRDARQPRGGPPRVRARHLRQRAARDLADPARRGGLRVRPHRPDHRQRARREADEALRRRRAARHRHRRPRALRARPRLPRRRAAPLAHLAHAVGQAGQGRLHPDGLDDPAPPRACSRSR